MPLTNAMGVSYSANPPLFWERVALTRSEFWPMTPARKEARYDPHSGVETHPSALKR